MPALVINKQYADGQVLSAAQLDAAFASITTLLNVVGLGSDNIQDNAIGSAEIQTSGVTNTNLATNSVSTGKIVDASVTLSKLDPTGVQAFLVPTGGSIDYFVNTSVPPSGFLICDGSAVSRTTYAALFAVVGTIYGTGDGTATFNLPNCADRVFRHIGTYSSEAAYALNSGTASMYQDDAIHDHGHNASITTTNNGSNPTILANGGGGSTTGSQSVSVPSVITFNGTGGKVGLSANETRVKAILGYKLIKY